MARSRRLTELGAAVAARVEARLPEGPLLVALSGGADSAVCAWAAVRAGRPVRAVHVDHGLPASPRLAEAARSIAKELGIDCDVAAVTVPAGPSPEAAARSVRYAAIEAAARPEESLLTGHTADDHAETVLANLVRGAGARGLAGIPARRGRWVRPLLEVTRTESRELATLAGLPFADDPENEAAEPRRNVLRRRVIPDLEAAFNPELRAALTRAAAHLAADEELLATAAARVPAHRDGAAVRLPAPLLVTLPEPVAARAVRDALRRLRPPHPGTAAEVAAVLAVSAREQRAATIAGLRVEREGPWVTIAAPVVLDALPADVPLTLPGSATLGDHVVSAWIETAPPAPWPLAAISAVVDADAAGAAATLRAAAPGERIDIGSGSKPVTDALAEAGIPARLRPGWPVVAAHGRLLWIAGTRAAHWAAVGPGTTRYLWLHLERTGT